jgi:hypothetical protein
VLKKFGFQRVLAIKRMLAKTKIIKPKKSEYEQWFNEDANKNDTIG